jgi:hypothetical protein
MPRGPSPSSPSPNCVAVCTLLSAPRQILPSLTKFARKALMDRFDPAIRIKSPVYPQPPGASPGSMVISLNNLLGDMVTNGRVQGIQVGGTPASPILLPSPVPHCHGDFVGSSAQLSFWGHVCIPMPLLCCVGMRQVCVVQGGAVLANVAAGTMGLLDHRPVTPSTLFPCLAVSRLGPIAILSALADAGLVCAYLAGYLRSWVLWAPAVMGPAVMGPVGACGHGSCGHGFLWAPAVMGSCGRLRSWVPVGA